MDPQQKSEDEIKTNRVLDYYKNFTQNPELSKYLTGSEGDLVRKTEYPKKNTKKQLQTDEIVSTCVELEIETNIEQFNICEENQEDNKNVSRASSVASNKKLEWDNGADIGYSNSYKLSSKKSASFPSIFTEDVSAKSIKSYEEKSNSGHKKDLRNMYHQLTFSSESSPSPPKEIIISSTSSSLPKEQTPCSSSSSQNENNNKKFSSSSSSSTNRSSRAQLAYLKKRIGVPVANSTPIDEINSKASTSDSLKQTPFLKVLSKPKRALNIEAPSSVSSKSSLEIDKPEYLNTKEKQDIMHKLSKIRKEINLCLTKPVSIECAPTMSKDRANKVIQTSFSSDKSSKSIQTEISDHEKIIRTNPINICSPQTLKIEFMQHEYSGNSSKSYSDKESQKSSDKSISVHSNKSDESKKKIIPQSPKKQLHVPEKDSIPEKEMIRNGSSTISSKSSKNEESKSSSCRNDQQVTESQAESRSAEMILADMISLNYSRDLNTDIKRSIDILQKLLKSKKYDKSTKKYYIKKIVQKIVESKYSDDSTTSSELFLPKKSDNKCKEVPKTEYRSHNTRSDVKLMDNIPWYPVNQPKFTNSDYKVTKSEVFENKNFINKGITKDDDYVSKTKKDLNQPPTLEKLSSRSTSSSPQDVQSSDGFLYKKYQNQEQTHKNEHKNSNDEQNWKGKKTLSELLIERRDKPGAHLGAGDYLLNVAKDERKHQLSWINNEIEHLVKLKDLLEKKTRPETKPESDMKDMVSSLLKMKVDDMKGISKNLEVYICRCKMSGKHCECSSKKIISKNKSKKKSASLTPGYYTIETQLDPKGNLMDLTVFDEKGVEKYNYCNDGDVDDVLITSKDHNTAVKLKPKSQENIRHQVPGPYKICAGCGKLFLPPVNIPELCLCEDCFEITQDLKPKTSRMKCAYKVCKDCGKLFIPPPNHQDLLLCSDCLKYQQNPERDDNKIDYNYCKICEECDKIFSTPKDNKDEYLCENCRIQPNLSNIIKTCRVCGNQFIPQENKPNQNVCPNCSLLDETPQVKCTCQKVNFSEPLELGICECTKRKNNCIIGRKNAPSTILKKPSFHYEEETVICPKCQRPLNQCICYLKFVPKTPLLVGNENYDIDELEEKPNSDSRCAHCREASKPKIASLSTRQSNPDYRCAHCREVSFETSKPKLDYVSTRQPNSDYRCAHCREEKFDISNPKTHSICKQKYPINPDDDIELTCVCGKRITISSATKTNIREKRENCKITNSDSEDINKKMKKNGKPCTHCIGVQVEKTTVPCSKIRSPSSSKSELTSPCPSSVSSFCVSSTSKSPSVGNISPCPTESRLTSTPRPLTVPCPSNKTEERKAKCIFKDTSTQYKPSDSKLIIPCPATSSGSSKESLVCVLKKSKSKELQPEKSSCCNACQTCSKQKSPLRSKEKKKISIVERISLKTKKSCQCCACTNCAVQTKNKIGKNARCQCCVCENCGTQATIDKDGIINKPMLSKWCKSKRCNTKRSTLSRKLHTKSVSFNKRMSDEGASCESLEYPCKPLKPKKRSSAEEQASEESFTCPAKSSSCPSKPAPCPGAGFKPCPAFPPKPCPGRKPAPCEDTKPKKKSSSCPGSKECPVKNPVSCPGKTPPCFYSREIYNTTCLPVTISTSPIEESNKSEEKSVSPVNSDRCIPPNDEVQSSKSEPISSPKGDAPSSQQQEIQVFICSTKNPSENVENQSRRNSLETKKSNFSETKSTRHTCKCNQTSTHEEKNMQFPASKECRCQTEPKEDAIIQCSCKGRNNMRF